MVNWQQIKTEFIAGATLKLLASKYAIPFATLKSRHAREKWSELRKKTRGKMQEKTIDTLSDVQAKNAVNAIELIDETITELKTSLHYAECYSKEGLARAINDLLKTRSMYTGETNTKENSKEFGINADEVIRATIEYLDSKPQPKECPELAIPYKPENHAPHRFLNSGTRV